MPNAKTSVPVKHVAKLANLNLPEAVLEKHQAGLNSVLTYIQEIEKLDLSAVPLTARVIDEENILREDEVEESLTQAEALKNAPSTHEGFFMVKAIFENKDA